MTFRVGFDLDGVLADMASAIDREATKALGAESQTIPEDEATPDDEPMPGVLPGPLTEDQQRQLWTRLRAIENFWESLDEIEPGAVARLWTIAQERRWEVIFLTKRPATAGRTSQLQSQLWLRRHGFPMPSVFVVQGSRGRIAAALDLDVVVDDTRENCVDVIAESRAKAILVSPEADDRVVVNAKRLGIHVEPSIGSCLDHLAKRPENA
jgi:hypothetical protein